jgi:hypothetical protein
LAYLEYSPVSPLFQYTNLAGFEGLLESKSIWLSDLKSTNDPREIVFGQEILQEAMALVRHSGFQGSRGLPLSILTGRVVNYLSQKRIYSASFTYRYDELPMWREYGDGGAGLAIGFRPRAIADMAVRVQKVQYLAENSSTAWSVLIQDALRSYENMEDISAVTHDIHVFTSLISNVVSAKHASWSYEDEIRITHAADVGNIRHSIRGISIPNYEYPDGFELFTDVLERERLGEKINYVSLPFGKYSARVHDFSRAVAKIVLGPKCECSSFEIHELLAEHGFEGVEVIESGCALR